MLEKAVVLLSGGLDSSVLLWRVRRLVKADGIHALTFRYGQKHEREIRMARWQERMAGVAAHVEVDLRFFRDLVSGGSALTDPNIQVPELRRIAQRDRRQPVTYVPNRNMVLLSLAAAHAEAKGIRDVFYGAQAQDEYGYWDCTKDFVARLNKLLSLNRKKSIRVRAPFTGMRKTDVVKLGLRLGVDFAHTWTCYRGAARPCGNCPSCVERATAFGEAGMVDPLRQMKG